MFIYRAWTGLQGAGGLKAASEPISARNLRLAYFTGPARGPAFSSMVTIMKSLHTNRMFKECMRQGLERTTINKQCVLLHKYHKVNILTSSSDVGKGSFCSSCCSWTPTNRQNTIAVIKLEQTAIKSKQSSFRYNSTRHVYASVLMRFHSGRDVAFRRGSEIYFQWQSCRCD